MRRLLALWVVLALSASGACGGADGEPDLGTLTVFAASSLQPVLTSLEDRIERELSLPIQFSFSSSPVAARQVVEGAPADLLITADQQSMDVALSEEVVESPTLVARSHLALIVSKGNPEAVAGLADLSRAELSVVLCDPDVPCGRLAAALLREAGVTAAVDSLEENAAAAVGKVALGEADVTIGYVTDVIARQGDLQQVASDQTDSEELVARYLAAVVRASPSRANARRLVELFQSPTIRSHLEAAGFLIGAS